MWKCRKCRSAISLFLVRSLNKEENWNRLWLRAPGDKLRNVKSPKIRIVQCGKKKERESEFLFKNNYKRFLLTNRLIRKNKRKISSSFLRLYFYHTLNSSVNKPFRLMNFLSFTSSISSFSINH